VNPNHLLALCAIRNHQPVMRADLWRICNLGIQRESFPYVLSTLVKKGLIHSAGRDGPVWVTVRGEELIDG